MTNLLDPNELSPKNDFYEYVNAEWLKTAKIPADKPTTGSFNQLAETIEKQLMHDFTESLTANELPENEQLAEFIKFYQLALDFEQREKDGLTPLLPILAKIEGLESLADYANQLSQWILDCGPAPFIFDLDTDMKNTSEHIFFASAPSLFLPDKTYYEDGNESGEKLIGVFKEMMTSLLLLIGKSQTESDQILTDALAFDRLIAPYTKSSEEAADILSIYNPQTIEEFKANSTHIDLPELLRGLVGDMPNDLIVTDLAYFKALDTILSEETFPQLKSWLLLIQIRSLSSYLTQEFREISGQYSLALSGSAEIAKPEKAAYYLSTGFFDQVVGNYYAHTYFTQEAKQDVTHMVEQMIAVYQTRLEKNTWLNSVTKDKAILKLNKLGIQVGYPEELPEIYTQLKTTTAKDGGSLLSNALAFSRLFRKDKYSKWGQPVDRLEWEMSAETVNAYYHPFKNIIVFPAAILQSPFYSYSQSASANYGGIGAVIAHEISHAFDNNGSSFDEYGNLNNWWTDEDMAHFKELSQQMIAQFDGLEFAGGKVNGTLTVSENIADAGGLSCALEAAKKEKNPDIEAFFTNWATVWRSISSKEYLELLLAVDVHSPGKIRANTQPKNLEDFYRTFSITEGDPMYLAPEKRVNIW